MSTMSQFFGGGGGIPAQFATNTSGSFVTPVAGKYLLTAIGGGGGGSLATNGRGGGAGGLAQSLVTLSAGVTLTLTVGAAGNPANPTGGTGGTTTISGSGFTTLTANGGAGGATTGATAGGTASGGTLLNVTGGSAGSVLGSGGGAVGVYGTTPAATTGAAGRSIGPFADQETSPANIFNGRLLQPSAGYFVAGTTGSNYNAPGQSGLDADQPSGAFAGGTAGSTQRTGGRFGGGGAGNWSAGGVGGVIIEYFIV